MQRTRYSIELISLRRDSVRSNAKLSSDVSGTYADGTLDITTGSNIVADNADGVITETSPREPKLEYKLVPKRFKFSFCLVAKGGN